MLRRHNRTKQSYCIQYCISLWIFLHRSLDFPTGDASKRCRAVTHMAAGAYEWKTASLFKWPNPNILIRWPPYFAPGKTDLEGKLEVNAQWERSPSNSSYHKKQRLFRPQISLKVTGAPHCTRKFIYVISELYMTLVHLSQMPRFLPRLCKLFVFVSTAMVNLL